MFGKKNKEESEEELYPTLPEYDFERDGSLVSPKLRKTDEVLEAYWIEPGLTRVSIIRTAEYENIYIAHEPALTPFEAELLERLQPAVRDLLIMKDIELNDRKEVLYESIDYLLDSYDLPLTNATVYKMRYYLKRTFFGWGRVDILRGDHDIEDISCSGYDLPVYLYHRKYRDIKTTIFFTDPRELDSLVVLFAQKSGKHISLSNPIVDATLSDGSRIQLTYSTVISTRGSSFTIRKFRKNPFSPIDLLVNHTFTIDEMVYLWMAVQYNYSILIVGGTASGKTTTLNAISQFIPALSKVVSIEDTREIMLEHDNWIASLVPLSSGASSVQRDITMFDLLKAAMRQRPEYILVGEVRGIEAQTLFQAMNSGHTTFSTLHGGDVTMAIHRLENPPLDVPKATIETLDIVLCQGSMFRNKKQVRRCKEITEIVGMTDKGELEVNTVYLYNFQKDAPSFSGTSQVYASIAEKTGMNMSTMGEDIRKRTAVLQAMLDQDIRDYRDFARIVWLFLSRPKYVMANVADLTQILPGKCKIHETLANPQIEKAEYPEMVDGPAESDAAYGTGSSISDRVDSPKVTRVCYVPDSQGVSFTVDSAPIPDSAEPGVCYIPDTLGVSSTVDYPPIPDSAAPGVSLLPDDVPESSDSHVTLVPDVVSEPEEPEVSESSDVVPESSASEESVSPDVVPELSAPEDSVSPDVVPESSASEESVSADVVPEPSAPEVGVPSDDSEDFFFDIHAPIRSKEEIFGPSESDPESIFEVAPEKDISSFDLYADEQNTDSSPEKK
ncbi:MAG: type II/IV secretion system ATPase subunit [Methanocorpusculum sp.]|uniref:type II/IV secretion system ATPase subunit n=1 Tax=Methanocorpusculum sp. TaxID=2058474 RepID=UPI0027257C66|nr:type II/IV secretion system ATPase subunit [Methanocorpusculum sp.]MDO9523332.1 type II/IV secretion system ATPase subunit [Methanocorpusculum sp.]